MVFDLNVIDTCPLPCEAVDNLLGEAPCWAVMGAVVADQKNAPRPDLDLTGTGNRFSREETGVMEPAEDVVRR